MATPRVRQSDPLAALRMIQSALANRGAEEVPDGWMTAEQWASAWSKSRCQSASLLERGATAGVMECRKFRIATGYGVREVKHYRSKP